MQVNKLVKEISALFVRNAQGNLDLCKKFAEFRDVFEDELEFARECNSNWGVKVTAAKRYVEIGQQYARLKKLTAVLPMSMNALHALATAPQHHFDALVKEGTLKAGVSEAVLSAALLGLATTPLASTTMAATAGKVTGVVAHTRGASDVVVLQKEGAKFKEFCTTFTPATDAEAWAVDTMLDEMISDALACQKRIKALLIKAA